MRAGCALLLVLALLLAARPHGHAAEQPATPAALPREFMGMVIRDPWYDFGTVVAGQPNYAAQDTMGANLARLGVTWVRLDFHIPVPVGAPGEAALVDAEIAKNDYFITQVAPRHGFKVLALLNFSMVPSDTLALNSTAYVASRYGGGVNSYMDAMLTRALSIADRYGPQIAAFEVLNEPNRLPPAGLGIAPTMFGRLITKFYRFCHAIPPLPPGEPPHRCSHARILMGGLHPRGTSDAQGRIVMSDTAYLKAVYDDPESFAGFAAANRRFPLDGVAYHPYPEEMVASLRDARVDQRLPFVRAALAEVGEPCRQLWVTEVGYNVGQKVRGQYQTEAGQMEFLRDIYTSLAARRLPDPSCGGQPEIANVFWFKYEDFPPLESDEINNVWAQRWGVVHIPFSPSASCPGGACYAADGRPAALRGAFFAYRELAGLPNQRVFLPIARR